MTIYVILFITALLIGIVVSMSVFGNSNKKNKLFKELYFSIEETERHVGILYTKGGDYSAILKIDNPVTQYCADIEAYYEFSNLLTSVVRTLGEGYALHKQDVFTRKGFEGEESDNREYLSESYFNYFEGRPYTECQTYITIVQEVKKGRFNQYDEKNGETFLSSFVR